MSLAYYNNFDIARRHLLKHFYIIIYNQNASIIHHSYPYLSDSNKLQMIKKV